LAYDRDYLNMTPHRLKLRAAMRRYAQAQSPAQVQNSLSQVGNSGDRIPLAAEVGKFRQFNAESGKYVFASTTQSVEIAPSQILSNGKLGVGQRVLLSQGTADFIPV
jgi:hypothetical protein